MWKYKHQYWKLEVHTPVRSAVSYTSLNAFCKSIIIVPAPESSRPASASYSCSTIIVSHTVCCSSCFFCWSVPLDFFFPIVHDVRPDPFSPRYLHGQQDHWLVTAHCVRQKKEHGTTYCSWPSMTSSTRKNSTTFLAGLVVHVQQHFWVEDVCTYTCLFLTSCRSC